MSTWIEFGTVGRPHGVHGELTLWLENKDSDNRHVIKNVLISKTASYQAGQVYKIKSLKPANDHWIMSLENIDTREAAAGFTNTHLFVDRDELSPCADGEIYLADIMGFSVIDLVSGQNLGKISSLIDYPQCVYLLIKREEEGRKAELELPWVPQFIKDIDQEQKIMHLELPEGMVDLTQWK